MSSNFRDVDRDTLYLLPPSLQEWLPEGHLARFVVEMVEQLDLRGVGGGLSGEREGSVPPVGIAVDVVLRFVSGKAIMSPFEQS